MSNSQQLILSAVILLAFALAGWTLGGHMYPAI